MTDERAHIEKLNGIILELKTVAHALEQALYEALMKNKALNEALVDAWADE